MSLEENRVKMTWEKSYGLEDDMEDKKNCTKIVKQVLSRVH